MSYHRRYELALESKSLGSLGKLWAKHAKLFLVRVNFVLQVHTDWKVYKIMSLYSFQ